MKKFVRFLAMMFAIAMLAGVLPMNVFAATAFGGYDDANGGSDYYNIISQKEWDLAPGVKETELVLNNDAGTRRQVLHTAIVDLNNEYVKVIPGTKGMWPEEGNYGTQSTSTQALEAEKLGYGNVVVATNASLSWYTEAYYKENPHLIGEPLGYSILDGQLYANSRWVEGQNSGGVATITVINYDYHPLTGEKRPDDMPKAWIRNATDPLTGWEEQAIPVLFTYLVKPDPVTGEPVNQYKEDHGSGIASRTFVGVRADGTLVLAVSDGEQAPYSVGFTSYEMAEYMIKMGCIIAANCDGGGSTTFCSQRPGEDLKVNCSLSDGGERPTSNTFLVVSTAKADGVFARAQLSSDYDYYTPGSSVAFSALGFDSVGTKVDIPDDVQWQIKESGMGTITNGVFTSGGTTGKATVQMVYDGEVVGEKIITIAIPDTLSFDQPVVTIPFGKTAKIPLNAIATIDGVAHEIGLGDNDVTFTTTNTALGVFSGLNFVAVEEANAPTDITSVVTATLNMGTKPTATVQLNLGKGSEVLWDFEGGQADIDEWNVINNRKNAEHWDYYLNLSLADKTNGQVHDGNYSMRLETNGLSSAASHSEQYAWIRLGVDGEAITLENAKRIGFWLYVPEDNIQCWVQLHYKTDSNGDGVFDTDNVVSLMESENVYYNIDESGWHYLSTDVSKFSEIMLAYEKQMDKDPSDGMTGEKGEFFLALVFHKGINNMLWQTNGSINGNYTYYLDNFTVDYSDAVEDRENPIIDKIYLDGTTALVKRDVVTTTSNILNLSAAVKDKDFLLDADKNAYTIYNVSGLNASTAKVYIDGVEVKSTFANGVLSANGIKVADGYHRVKFEICDNAGNKSVIIRVIKVESGSSDSTLALVPADPTLDRIYFGSIYWMNLEATAIETIQKVETVIDLNNVNHWQLDHMELAEGFTATYTINEETNTATITITRTGTNYDSGAAVLAKLPVRILYFDTDIKTPGYTAETYWTKYPFWAQDMKMDVDMGLITFTNGTTGTFSNEEFHVDTEMYTSMANMDKAYFSAHGTTHVHNPVALADKTPTCVENGYTGRTFCYGCNSVVEWGTTVPATGHTFEVDTENRTLVCDCGRVCTSTGLHIIDGKGYYTTAGTLTGGWLTIDEEWYYFDTETYSSVPTFYNGYVTYKFYEEGKLVSGEWHKSSAGIRYYEGPSYIRGGKSVMTWYTIDGKDYCIDKQGYVATGTRWVNDQNGTETYTWHHFDENGVHLGKWNYTGIVELNGEYYYLKDGISQIGMYLVDGNYYYFYWTNYRVAIKNQRFSCPYSKHNHGLLPVGSYYFGPDGKMLNNTVYNIGGTLYYFVLGNESKGSGSVEIDGKQWNVEDNGKVIYTGFYKDANDDLQYYENGVQVGNHKWNNGIVTTEPTCTSNGIKTYTCSECNETKDIILTTDHIDENDDFKCDTCGTVVEHDHVWNEGVITTPATCTKNGVKTYTCKCSETKTETILAPGHIDETGDLACDICGETVAVKNGVVFDSDGNVRYYVDGKATRAGLVQDSKGNYYYINSSLKAVKNCTYAFSASMSNGLLPSGTYQFDATGKMIDPPAGEFPHQHVWGEGVVTTPANCTDGGVRTYICECGLSKTEAIEKLGHTDEVEDYKCDRCGTPIAHDHVWNEGIVTTPANCTEEGVKTYTCKCGEIKTEKLEALGHIDEDEDFACDRCGTAVEHIHAWNDGEITTPATCTKEGVKTYTCKCGETKTEPVATIAHADENDDFKCDTCGTVVEHDHVWNEGVITTPATCTKDGVKTYACKCGETKTETVAAPGKHIDENGDLTCDICGETVAVKNGVVFDSDGNVRYYVDGKATRAGLVQDSKGNYYYINSSLKAVKNCTYAFSASMSNGLLPSGTYQFDATGKMIDPPAGEFPHQHVWGEGVVTTPANCTDGGVRTYICECGLSKTEAIEKLGHTDEVEDYKCDRCGTPIAHDHVWNEGIVTTPANCTEEGVKTYTCKCGEIKTEKLEALGHIDEDEDFACDRCGTAVEHIHAWNDGEITTPATCTKEGVKTYTCKCGETKTEPVATIAHADENDDFKCDTCGTVVEHDHVWNEGVITTPATCTKDGVKTYACKCGETKTETVAAPGKHIDENGDLTCDICGETVAVKNGVVFDSDGNVRYYVDGKATRAGLVQDSKGNYYYINSSLKAVKNCTYAFSASMSNGLLPSGTYQFDATGKMIDPPAGEFPHQHVWGEGVVTTPANCTDGGVRTYICECGLSKTEAIEKLGHTDEVEDYKCDRCGTPIAHDHVWNEGIVTTPANCTEEGVKTYTCKCGEIKTEKLEALGHIDEDEDFACDRCGTAVEHIHAWNDGEITTPATCTKEGVKTYTCKCGETKTEPVATIAHADENDDFKCDTCGTVVEHDHVWNEGVITTPATCTKDGVKTYACKCGETKTETVAAPGKHIDENGDLTCDICGETVAVKNGVVFDSDGNVRYYVDGKATRAGLVQDSKGNYYYINSSLKAVKNCTYAFSTAMGNGLMPGGTYKFDASGKMILD